MNKDLNEFFIYTRSERNGMFVLVAICVALVIAPTIYKKFFVSPTKTDFSEFQDQIDSFFQSKNQNEFLVQETNLFEFNLNTVSAEDLQKLGVSEKTAKTLENYRNKGGKFYKKEDFKKIYGITDLDYNRLKNFIVLESGSKNDDIEKLETNENSTEVFELFEFDPNTATEDDLHRLGLSAKVIQTMMNYRNKGGTFYAREDLSKIYGISDDDFERLFPYIKIAEKQETKTQASIDETEIPQSYETTKNDFANEDDLKIEINSATPEEWQQLKGIGPSYSKWICGFRDKLGGFYSIDQIAETYNLPDTTFQKIKPFLILEGEVKKINLNKATAKELSKHPYLNWKQANAIVKYREQHSAFSELRQLGNIKILDQKLLEKMNPYFQIKGH